MSEPLADLDAILALHPRPQGPPAFDPAEIDRRAAALPICVDTGHPLLDRVVRVSLAHIDLTFQGDHPKYGQEAYFWAMHDGFSPTIIAAIDALSVWGLIERADQLWRYWLRAFVDDQGKIQYYGASLSEYGQLLHTAALLKERGGEPCIDLLRPLAGHVKALVANRDGKLVAGVPEADEADRPRRYFHNNAWLATGLRRWSSISGDDLGALADDLERDTLASIRRVWDDAGWPAPEEDPIPANEIPKRSICSTRLGSYANYRYWPELLSSGILPTDLAEHLVEARESMNGQFYGTTRFEEWLDDWPLFDHLVGLWALGRRDDLLQAVYGHVAYHHAEGHLTAYEQITLPPGRPKAPYCLPVQLVVPRAIGLIRSKGN